MASAILRRYTDLPALIYLLRTRKITLLDPQSWDDKNDSSYLAIYRERRSLACVLALCFAESRETYHHWRVFAPGASGVCIRFHKTGLIRAIKREVDVRTRSVQYLKLGELRTEPPRIDDLPFLKRYAFEHESEYRVLYESPTDKCASLDVSIPLSTIEQITLSPWMHNGFADHVTAVIHGIRGCNDLEVFRSTLIGNQRWLAHGQSAE